MTIFNTEAKVIVVNHDVKKEIWIRKTLNLLVRELSAEKFSDEVESTKIMIDKLQVDNMRTICIASESENQQRIKHYDIQYF